VMPIEPLAKLSESFAGAHPFDMGLLPLFW